MKYLKEYILNEVDGEIDVHRWGPIDPEPDHQSTPIASQAYAKHTGQIVNWGLLERKISDWITGLPTRVRDKDSWEALTRVRKLGNNPTKKQKGAHKEDIRQKKSVEKFLDKVIKPLDVWKELFKKEKEILLKVSSLHSGPKDWKTDMGPIISAFQNLVDWAMSSKPANPLEDEFIKIKLGEKFKLLDPGTAAKIKNTNIPEERTKAIRKAKQSIRQSDKIKKLNDLIKKRKTLTWKMTVTEFIDICHERAEALDDITLPGYFLQSWDGRPEKYMKGNVEIWEKQLVPSLIRVYRDWIDDPRVLIKTSDIPVERVSWEYSADGPSGPWVKATDVPDVTYIGAVNAGYYIKKSDGTIWHHGVKISDKLEKAMDNLFAGDRGAAAKPTAAATSPVLPAKPAAAATSPVLPAKPAAAATSPVLPAMPTKTRPTWCNNRLKKGPVETTICRNRELWQLDNRLNQLYHDRSSARGLKEEKGTPPTSWRGAKHVPGVIKTNRLFNSNKKKLANDPDALKKLYQQHIKYIEKKWIEANKATPAAKPATGVATTKVKIKKGGRGSKSLRQEKLSKDIGLDLVVMQKVLNAFGYYAPGSNTFKTGDADGKYGSETEQAIENLQKDVGLTGKDVDGLWGPKTLAAFKENWKKAKGEYYKTPPVKKEKPPEIFRGTQLPSRDSAEFKEKHKVVTSPVTWSESAADLVRQEIAKLIKEVKKVK